MSSVFYGEMWTLQQSEVGAGTRSRDDMYGGK
jgi:hypothetical protein